MNWVEFGQKMKAARQKKGMTQKDLATEMDCSREFICQIETGIKKPSAENLIKIKKILNIDLE